MKAITRDPVGRRAGRIFVVICSAFATILVLAGAVLPQGAKASSVLIHDTTAASAGGENSTSGLRNAIRSALEREKPCVEPMDDQDVREALDDERSRALLEGGDSNDTLKALGDRMDSGVVISVKGVPGPGGTMSLSASGLDTRTARMVANEAGGPGSEKRMADDLVKSLGPYLADQCKPHWAGTIRYISTSTESKSTNDKGAMRAASRNTKRDITESSTMTEMIKATLLPPDESKRQTVNSTRAKVMHRTSFVYSKHSTTNGELYCRMPGKNPFWKGFSESFNETTTMLGQGTDTMQLFISFDGDGGYSIKVTAPGGPLYGKFESTRKATGCDEAQQEPTMDAYSLPEGRIQATSFDAEGRTGPNPTSLTGSQTLPDGKTKISWNLRLVKPKGK